MLASVRFISLLDLKIKNWEPNQTRSVQVGSVQFWTEPNKVGYFLGLDFRFHRFCLNHLHPGISKFTIVKTKVHMSII